MKTAILCLFLVLGACSAAPKDDDDDVREVSDSSEEKQDFPRKGKAAILIPPSVDLLTREASLSPIVADRNSEICGIRRNTVPDAITRIVGGSPSEEHEFPWQVSLQWRYNWYTYHTCGATVIDQNWILTAAHCTHQFKPKDLIVVAGDHNIKSKEGTEQSRYVQRIVEHHDYNSNTQENDIAMIKLSAPLILDGLTVAPVCLPPPMTNFTGGCLVTGWGDLFEGGVNSDELHKVIVPIITDNKCQNSYREIGYSGPIVDSMICAGYDYGFKDACQGDSGGPLVCRGYGNRYYLAGVVSWGIGCARPNVPGVYTEVSRYIPWISNVVSGLTRDDARPANLRVATLDELSGVYSQEDDDELMTSAPKA